jgi:phage gp29-like protein
MNLPPTTSPVTPPPQPANDAQPVDAKGGDAFAEPIVDSRRTAIAPWPSIDKTGTIVIGPGLSLAYVSAIFRLSMLGFRAQYVDLLDELLEKDPHAFSVLDKRVKGVSGGKVEVTPAKCVPGSNDEKLANELAQIVEQVIDGVPELADRLTELSWATYYGLVGEEIHWVRDGRGWMVDRLSLVHSRRLSYPVSGSWDLYVWDQGQVHTDWRAPSRTQGVYGLRIGDAPSKFIVHAPQIRGGYPTRNGLGRQIAYWMVLKLVASRNGPQYLERFAKPWPEATFETETNPKTDSRVATTEDIAAAKAALAAMGAGTLTSWVHPDTVKLELRTPDGGVAGAKLTFPQWIEICDSQMSKACLGGTLGTDVGSTGGNRALGETQRKSEIILYRHDAGMLGSTLKRDLVASWVRLNYRDVPRRLLPHVKVIVDDDADPIQVVEKYNRAATAGFAVDMDEAAREAGLPLVKPNDPNSRRLIPTLPQGDPSSFDEDLAARKRVIGEVNKTLDSDQGAAAGDDGKQKPPTPPPPSASKGANDNTDDTSNAPPHEAAAEE